MPACSTGSMLANRPAIGYNNRETNCIALVAWCSNRSLGKRLNATSLAIDDMRRHVEQISGQADEAWPPSLWLRVEKFLGNWISQYLLAYKRVMRDELAVATHEDIRQSAERLRGNCQERK